MGQEFAQGAEWDHETGPQWWVLAEDWPAAAEHRGVQDLVRELNRLYTDSPALWQRDNDPVGFSWLDGGAADDNLFSFVRHDAVGNPLISVSNLSPVVRHGYRIGLPDTEGTRWLEVLNTDAEAYGGSGIANPDPLKAVPTPWNGRPISTELTLPPLATLWLTPA
jgi:1,4-alpha-glucan branching enzyme